MQSVIDGKAVICRLIRVKELRLDAISNTFVIWHGIRKAVGRIRRCWKETTLMRLGEIKRVLDVGEWHEKGGNNDV